MTRKLWCGVPKKRGDKVKYDNKIYKVLSCSNHHNPPEIGKGYRYYLTVTELK